MKDCKFDFIDWDGDRVAGKGKVTGKVVDGEKEILITIPETKNIEKDEYLYLDDSDLTF